MHRRPGLLWLTRLAWLAGLTRLLLGLLLLRLARCDHSHLLLLHWIVLLHGILEPLLLLWLLLPLLLATNHVLALLTHLCVAHLLLRRHHHLRVALAAEALHWLLVRLSLCFFLNLLNRRQNSGGRLRSWLATVTVHHARVHALLALLHSHLVMLHLLTHHLRLLLLLLLGLWLLWSLLLRLLRGRRVPNVLLGHALCD